MTSPTVGVVPQADAIRFVNALAAYATLPVLKSNPFGINASYDDHVGYDGHESTKAEVRLYDSKLFLYGELYELYECLGVCVDSSVKYVLLFSKPGRVFVPTVVPDKKPRITNVRGVVTKLLSGAVARTPGPTPLASTTTIVKQPDAQTTGPTSGLVPVPAAQHLLCYVVHYAGVPQASGYYSYWTPNMWYRQVSSSESHADAAFLRLAGTQGTFGVSLGNRVLRQLTLGNDASDHAIVQLPRPTARPTSLPSEVGEVIQTTKMAPLKLGANELFGVWTTSRLANGTSLCVSRGPPHTGGPFLISAEYIAYGIGETGTVTYLWYIESGKKVYFEQPSPTPAPGGSVVSWLSAPSHRRVMVVIEGNQGVLGAYAFEGTVNSNGAALDVFVRRADSSVDRSTEWRVKYDPKMNEIWIEDADGARLSIQGRGLRAESTVRPVSGAFLGAKTLILWDAGASAMRSYVFTALGAHKDVYLCLDMRGEPAYLTVSGLPHEGGPEPPVARAKWCVYVHEGHAPKRLAYRAYHDEGTKTWMFKDKTSASFARVEWLLCVDRK